MSKKLVSPPNSPTNLPSRKLSFNQLGETIQALHNRQCLNNYKSLCITKKYVYIRMNEAL